VRGSYDVHLYCILHFEQRNSSLHSEIFLFLVCFICRFEILRFVKREKLMMSSERRPYKAALLRRASRHADVAILYSDTHSKSFSDNKVEITKVELFLSPYISSFGDELFLLLHSIIVLLIALYIVSIICYSASYSAPSRAPRSEVQA